MALYVVGEYLREIRIRKGYSQESVCHNICTAATLSRIENGRQYPGKRLVDKLLERLGVETEAFDLFVNAEEMEIYELIQMMSRNIANSNMEELEKQITLLESLSERSRESERQYILWAKGVLHAKRGGSPEEVLALFMEAIHVTLPEFDGYKPLKSNLLTFDEIMIINGIAIQYARRDEYQNAIKLGYWLKEYMEEKLVDGKTKVIKYVAVMYDLSNWLGKMERFHELLELAEIGVDYCKKNSNLMALPLLLFNKAYALAELKRIEEAKVTFAQSITIFEVLNQNDKVHAAIDLCRNRYNIIF